MRLEAQQPDAQSTDQKQQADTGELLGLAIQQQVAQALQPELADIQRCIAEIVQQRLRLSLQRVSVPGGEELAQTAVEQLRDETEGAGDSVSFALTLGGQQAEPALRSVLSTVLEVLFSGALRATLDKQGKETAQSLVAASRTALPEEESRNKIQKRTEQMLDRMLDQLFSSSMRDQAQKDGDRIVAELVRGDIPSARREAENALQSFAERWGSVAQEHWDKIFQALLTAVMDAAKQNSARRARDAAEPSSSERAEIPKTILRSDKRAQEIWKKARDRAAKQDGTGGSANRAAYEALKQEFEKKGDRWVKKSAPERPRSRSARERKTRQKSAADSDK